MSAQGPTIADAIVSDCNAATWSEVCTFERRYLPIESVESVDKVVVQVVYAGQTTTASSRGSWEHDYQIDFGVMAKLPTDDLRAADRYSTLLDAILDYWKTHKPTGTDAVMRGGEWLQPYVPQHMQELRQFTGVIRLTFRLVRT